jgi:hypothetical protein
MPDVDWDGWRRDYDTMSFAEHQAFSRLVYDAYPVQKHYCDQALRHCLQLCHATTVWEVGGYDGAAAQAMLAGNKDLRAWGNMELCPVVPVVCHDGRYHHVTLDCWPWEHELASDLLVLSHVIEHMRLRQARTLLAGFSGGWLYIDTPLPWVGAPSWEHSTTTHILEVGWDGLLEMLDEEGWVLQATWGDADGWRDGIGMQAMLSKGRVSYFDRTHHL